MIDTSIFLTDTQASAHAGAHKQFHSLNVLIACEESQAECSAFRALGHNAFSGDIQTCRKSGNPEWHIHGNVLPFLNGCYSGQLQSGNYFSVPKWDLIIAHPPCTYLTKLSAVCLHTKPDIVITFRGKLKFINRERYMKMIEARSFFFQCLSANADYVAVENPIPMAIAQLPKASCFIHPSWYGVKYTKKTLYWLKNLPPLMPEIYHPNPKCYVTCSKGKYRSRTFPEVAKAIAKQWSEYILQQS